jgi:hypothetical protein
MTGGNSGALPGNAFSRSVKNTAEKQSSKNKLLKMAITAAAITDAESLEGVSIVACIPSPERSWKAGKVSSAKKIKLDVRFLFA